MHKFSPVFKAFLVMLVVWRGSEGAEKCSLSKGQSCNRNDECQQGLYCHATSVCDTVSREQMFYYPDMYKYNCPPPPRKLTRGEKCSNDAQCEYGLYCMLTNPNNNWSVCFPMGSHGQGK